MIKKAKAIGLFASMFLLSASVVSAYSAADSWSILPTKPGGLPGDFDTSIQNIINWMLGFVAALAVLVIIYGGLTYVASTGDQERVKTSKQAVKYALMGLLISGIAYAAVNLVIAKL